MLKKLLGLAVLGAFGAGGNFAIQGMRAGASLLSESQAPARRRSRGTVAQAKRAAIKARNRASNKRK
jgi:hypothetical protein